MTVLSVRRARLVSAAPSRALHYLPATTFALDAIVIIASTVLAIVGRLELDLFSPSNVDATHENVGWLAPLIVIAWLLAIFAFGGYSASVFGAGPDEYKRVVHASLLTAGLIGVACYLAKYQLSRGFFLLVFVIAIPALIVGRLALRRAVHRAHVNGALRYRVVIAGSPGHIDEIAGVLRREAWLGYEVVGALYPESRPAGGGETPRGIPIIGNTDEITWSVLASRANLVFFAGGAVESGERPAPDRVGAGEARRPGRRGPERHRGLRRPGQVPPRRWPAADPRRPAARDRGRPLGQAPLRRGRLASA